MQQIDPKYAQWLNLMLVVLSYAATMPWEKFGLSEHAMLLITQGIMFGTAMANYVLHGIPPTPAKPSALPQHPPAA